jgi:hypothetical protein
LISFNPDATQTFAGWEFLNPTIEAYYANHQSIETRCGRNELYAVRLGSGTNSMYVMTPAQARWALGMQGNSATTNQAIFEALEKLICG